MKNPTYLKTLGILLLAASSTSAAVMSLQQGDLRLDGALFGAGAAYAGAVDGSVNDNNPTATITAITSNVIGNQYQATTNANTGTSGIQWNGLFSYNLIDLANYLAANPGFSVSAASFTLIKTTTGTAGSTLNLYQTQPFTGSASWNTYDGTNAWPAPNAVNNGGGLVGGGSELLKLNSNGVFSNGSSPMTWSNSANSNFVDAITNALARGDKTLYMAVITDSGFNGDGRITYSDLANATVDNRPELSITLVPEPSTALLGALGAIVLLRRRR
jgi:hypothetical protein